MRRKLNPELVKIRCGSADNGWVFLRDPKYTAIGREAGIGHEEIELIQEPDTEKAASRQQLWETEAALSALSGVPQEREPYVALTRDCFGIEGAVRLLIYSDKPFA